MIKGFLPEQNTEKTTHICQSNTHTHVLCCFTSLFGLAVETKGGGGSCSLCYLMATYSVIVGEVQYLCLYQLWLKYIFFFMGMYYISSLNINSRRNFCFLFFFINLCMCVCLYHDDLYLCHLCVCIYVHIYIMYMYINMCIYSLCMCLCPRKHIKQIQN